MNNLFGSKVQQINRPYCLKKKAGGIVEVEGAQEGEEVNEEVAGQGQIVYHLSDLECIYIHICITELDKNENAPTQIEFPNVAVDLKQNTGFLLSHPQEELELVVADPDDPPRLAPQPENGDSIEFDISPYLKQDGIFDLQAGLFCETWAFQRYGYTTALPTLREIMDGLKLFFQQFIDDHMKENKTKEQLTTYKNQVVQVIDKILWAADLKKLDEKIPYDDLQRPSSAFNCMVLYLYSLQTPLRWFLNYGCTTCDPKYIETLGPYANVFYEILGENVEQQRTDTLERGINFHHPKEGRIHPCGFLNQAFMLFKFTYLRQ